MGKKVLRAVITGGKDQFGAWIEGVSGIYAAGDTLEETKADLIAAIDLFIENNEKKNVPEVLKYDYVIKYEFDTSGFLKYYSKYISFAGMKEITGVNQKQLWSYANGYRRPSKETSERIIKALHSFGENMSQVQLHF